MELKDIDLNANLRLISKPQVQANHHQIYTPIMAPNKVALITGGASGMGLAVATALSARGNWTLHLVDLNETAGKDAASSLPNAQFHKTNVTSYASLSSTFETAFKTSGQLDFVFANAGIVERDNFYEVFDAGTSGTAPPPEPNQLSIDINLKAVVNTSVLALHYFRLSPHKGKDASLIMTASCGGLVSPPQAQF